MSTPPPNRRPGKPREVPVAYADEESTQVGAIDSALLRKQSRRDRAYLIVLAGDNIGQMFPVQELEMVIGRSQEATVRLLDDGVSRRHARLVNERGVVSIEDLGSANGTLINGRRVERTALEDGDKIQVGSTTILKFTYADHFEEDFQQKMYEAALHDGLTKAYTKRYFMDRLPTEIAYAKRHATPLSLVMFDVDHFKKVNDVHGHLAGDRVLTALATTVSGALRAEDIFARYGGEEFAVICRGIAIENAMRVGERLRRLIENAVIEYQGLRIPVTISVGVAAHSDGPDPATDLVAAADKALYEAKKTGRNRVVKG
ncbi:MAG TPA: GGDEF domain-containing protein [Polyangiaceae bacterium]|nr:GGDEF domain-containing protein [Polyangiaceae bacterium]